MNSIPRIFYCLIFGLSLLFFFGCAGLRPTPDPVGEKIARSTANRLIQFNQSIKKSKGTGWVVVRNGSQKNRFRIAWAAAFPDRVRMAFLIMGQPAETIIADGEQVLFLSHTGKHNPHTLYSANPNLESYLGVPITLREVISVLCGRLPLKNFDQSYLPQSDNSGNTIILYDQKKGPVQNILLNNNHRVKNIISTNLFNNRLYEYTIGDFLDINNLKIPSPVNVSGKTDHHLHLNIIRFTVNPEIKESVFMLTEQ